MVVTTIFDVLGVVGENSNSLSIFPAAAPPGLGGIPQNSTNANFFFVKKHFDVAAMSTEADFKKG